MRKKKLKLPLRRIIDNNIFMFQMIRGAAPGLLGAGIMVDILDVCQAFLFSTLILQYTINGISEGKSFREMEGIVWACMIFAVITVVLCSVYDEKFYKLRMIDLKKNIHKQLYEKAAEVELRCYENPEYYDRFVKAIHECAVRADELVNATRKLVMRIVSFMLNGTLIVTINPFLMIFAFLPLMVAFAQAKMNHITYQKKMELLEEERNKEYVKRVFYLGEYAKEMRLTNMPELMIQRFKESGDRAMEIIKKHGRNISKLRYLVWECRYNLAPLGATFCAVWQAFVSKTIGYGDCLVIVNAIDRVSGALSNSSDELMKFQESALFIENLRAFFEYKPELVGGEAKLPEEGDLVLEHVSFCYEGAKEATLQDVSMRFGAKEKIAIVGHNGAGKTTLVKLLLRLYDAEGSISYGGIDIKEFALSEYRQMFSAVMQDFHVFALSVADNVRLDIAKEQDDLMVKEAIEKSGLSEKVKSFSHGIETLMTREFDNAGEQMSGGERQKLAISHVYYRNNRFVILDEPSSALDPIAEYEMYNRMLDACKECGMIFISHRLASAVLADRIYLMEHGRVLECGSHQELMEKNEKYAEMFKRQAENYLEGTSDEEKN